MSKLEKVISNMMEKLKDDPELWEWFCQFTPNKKEGYILSTHPNIYKLSKLVESDHHSGSSFAYTCKEVKARISSF
jgi:hypothetical protein